MSTRWLCRLLAGLVVQCAAAGAFGATVVVPTDQSTVQAAVTAAGAGGTVIINSNAIFNETVIVTQSLTIHGGVGFTPSIRGTSTCGVVPSCTLFFEPNSDVPQMLAVSGVRFLPKSSARGTGPEVVRMLNRGPGDASLILSGCSIEDPEGFGFLAVDIRRNSCSTGLNHVSFQNGSITISGANEGFAGEGGFEMGEGGSLNVSNVQLAMSGIAAQAFEIVGTPNCGGITFGLSDSHISVSPPTTAFSADIAFLLLDVTATIERTSFQALSNGEGLVGGILAGGGTGQTFSTSITLDANRFSGSGPNVGDAVHAAASHNGAVVVKATNNVIQGMKQGFRLGQPVGNSAGDVTATVANNTVDGSSSDAVSLNSADGSSASVALQNNLLTHSAGWGVALFAEAGGSLTLSEDYNGFFDNPAGTVEPPLAGGLHDVVGDPVYADRASGDLHLGVGSPMIAAGNNALVFTATDADGAMRIQDDTVDIGAFEGGFEVVGPTNTPTPSPTMTPTPSNTATDTPTQLPTATSTATASVTSTATPTFSPTVTPTATATTKATATAPPTPTLTPQPCVGDCDGSANVTVDELLTVINIALGLTPPTACMAGDPDKSGQITIDEILTAVNNALNSCQPQSVGAE